MISNMRVISKKAFSLLELTIVTIIISFLLTIAVPSMYRAYLEKAGKKTAFDISAVQEAARAYYIDHNQWPDNSVYMTPIAALQAGNYLPLAWKATNPFGVHAANPTIYNYNTTSAGSIFIVSTYVPVAAEPIIQNLLPTNWTAGNIISSSISVPGATSVVPAGSIIPWASPILPVGFLLCDGQIYHVSNYPVLANAIGNTYGGDGINTFGVPNLKGKTIFGYQAGDSNFGRLGNTGGSTTMVGDGQWSSGHADTSNWYNQVKISGGSLYGMTGAQTAQGVSTAVLNPYVTLNYVIKT
jgi:prepilin-type N-terminal cleavage/methylation domain-containing protein